MNYYYLLYGFDVSSNVQLPLPIFTGSAEKIFLCVHYENTNTLTQSISIETQSDTRAIVTVSPYGHYVVDVSKQQIDAYCPNINALISTLFNLPFSVYALFTNRVLLHATGIRTPHGLILFSGDKGAGKSTFATAACKKHDNIQLFCDDTVLADSEGHFFRGDNHIKLCDDTATEYTEQNEFSGRTNVTGKKYVCLEKTSPEYVSYAAKGLYVLSRRKQAGWVIRNCENNSLRTSILFGCIVGIGVMPISLYRNISSNPTFKRLANELPIGRIYLEDNRNCLEQTVSEIMSSFQEANL